MMSEDDLHEDMGALKAEVGNLKTDMAEVMADVRAMRVKMDQAWGGWRASVIMGGIASAVGAGVHHLGQWLLWAR